MWLMLNKSLILLFLLVLREPGHHIMEEEWWCGDARGQGVEGKPSPATGTEEPSDIAKLRHRLRGLSHLWAWPARRGLSIPGPRSGSSQPMMFGPRTQFRPCHFWSWFMPARLITVKSARKFSLHAAVLSWLGAGGLAGLSLRTVHRRHASHRNHPGRLTDESWGKRNKCTHCGPRIQSSLDVRWGWWTQRWLQKACQLPSDIGRCL